MSDDPSLAFAADMDENGVIMGGRASGRLVPSRDVDSIGMRAAADHRGDDEDGYRVMRSAAQVPTATDEDDEITVVWGELLQASISAPPLPIRELSHTHASRPYDADEEVVGMNAVSVAQSLLACVRDVQKVSASHDDAVPADNCDGGNKAAAGVAASGGDAAAGSEASAAAAAAELQARRQAMLDEQVSFMQDEEI